MSQLGERVFNFVYPLFSAGSSVIAAVSGGSDSVALLFILYEIKERLGISELAAAHLNHGLRAEESDGDEMLVGRYAERLGIRLFTKKLSGYRLDEPCLEASLRRERYRFFEEIRKEFGRCFIATGHTMDDQAETVLMRIMRGSGLVGLRGIVPLREDGVIRPLLQVRRQELIEWLRHNNISYRTDSSNDDLRFLRNRIRHLFLPQMETWSPGISVHLARIAEEATLEWGAKERRVNQWCKKSVVHLPDGSFSVERKGLMERDLAAEGLRITFIQYGITPYRHHILTIIENGYRAPKGTFLLPGGWRCRYCRDLLMFEKGIVSYCYKVPIPGVCEVPEEGRRISIALESSLPENLDCGKWCVYIDGEELKDCCIYRNVKRDDTFIPFGGSREVRLLEFLAKQGIGRPWRDRTACLVDGNNKVIWIPGVRVAERFRITAATKKVIKLQSERI